MPTVSGTSGIHFDAPEALRPDAQEKAIDSAVEAWSGGGLEVVVDRSSFADPLTGYGQRPEHAASLQEVGGRPARVVEFTDEDGSHVAGVHFPGQGEGATGVRDAGLPPMTVIVRSSPGAPRESALRVVHSIRFTG